MYETFKRERDKNFAINIREQWQRHLDNCSIFWERSKTDLAHFESVLNSLYADVQFKVQNY